MRNWSVLHIAEAAVQCRGQRLLRCLPARQQSFLLSIPAGGQGINLTSADTVILHDTDFNPQIECVCAGAARAARARR